MLKKITITFLLLFSIISFSQCNDCFKNYGGWVHESVSDIKKINSETSILINTQGGGYYPKIIKHDSNCNIIFEKTFSSEYLGLEKHIYDNQGNCYLLISYGFATITTSSGPFLVSGITLYKGLNLVKLNATGSLLWSKAISNFEPSAITNIFYFNNEIIITGNHTTDNTTSGSNIYNLPETNNQLRTYISKFNLDGIYINSIYVNNSQDDFINSEIDSNGNIYMTKIKSFTHQTSSIIKVSSNLILIWTKIISNSGGNQSSFIPTKLYFNSTNNKLYLWGAYNDTVTILGNTFSTNNTNNSIFQSLLIEFNTLNCDLLNIKRFDNSSSANLPFIGGSSSGNTGYITHKGNELYVFSSFKGTMNFDNTSVTSGGYIDSVNGINQTFYIEDLVLFKVNLTTFNSEFLFKSFNNSPYINSYSQDYPSSILFHNDELYLTANFTSKPLSLNNSLVNNNSGNQNFDVLFFKLSTNSISNTIFEQLNPCEGSNIALNAPSGTNHSWSGPNGFSSNIQNPNILNLDTTDSGQYICNITGPTGCNLTKTITIQIQSTPTPTGNSNQSFCSTANATVTDIAITGTNIIWYNSTTNTTPLASTTLLTNNTTYYATQTINGCESVNRLAVTINLINTLNATNYSEIICDNLNDNVEIKNLTSYNSNLISSTGNIFSYYNSYNNALSQNSAGQITNFTNYNLGLGTNTFYVRIDSPNTCFQVVTLTLELVSKPIIPINDIAPICEGSFITLNGGNNYDSYTWSTGENTQQITITQPGNYSVIVTENHGATTCTSTKNFSVVNSNIATIQEIISADWTENNNTITVHLNSNSQGDYEYSLNGINFQDSNTFNNLEAGEYTVVVRDKNGCGIVSEELYLLMYPKFFTPNGDGYNDYWKIKFSENEPNLTVKIFDRYGKFIKQLGTNSIGWDGKYLGEDVPSSDYWFVVTRENGKEYKGHFSLKR